MLINQPPLMITLFVISTIFTIFMILIMNIISASQPKCLKAQLGAHDRLPAAAAGGRWRVWRKVRVPAEALGPALFRAQGFRGLGLRVKGQGLGFYKGVIAILRGDKKGFGYYKGSTRGL